MTSRLQYTTRAIALGTLIFTGGVTAGAQATAPINTLTAAEQRDGWKLLFDGKALTGWRQFKGDSIPPGWDIVDGHIVKARVTRDIVSREEFGDFEFVFEWKLTVAGNAGVFYRASEQYDRVYWSGPEYQLLDNIAAADNRTPTHLAGAVYDFYVPASGHDKPSVFDLRDTVRGPDGMPVVGRGGRARLAERRATPADIAAFLKAGEWNVSKIIAKGNHVEHWLNGFKVAEYDIGSPDWESKYQASKFTPYPNFARLPKGRFALQGDHDGILAFRNLKVRELK